MTRFEWAYPSGVEDVKEQWISGSTMILAIVIMNAVYLVSETRVQVGEPPANMSLLFGARKNELFTPERKRNASVLCNAII